MVNDDLHANPFRMAGIIQKLMDAEKPQVAETTVTGNRMRKPITAKGTRRMTARSMGARPEQDSGRVRFRVGSNTKKSVSIGASSTKR